MSHAPSSALSLRHQNIRQACAARGLDALLVTSLPNILYLTNFTGSSAIVVLTADRLYFITDFRYVTALEAMRETPCACPDIELIVVDGSYDGSLAALLRSMPSARVGFEAANLTVARHSWLAASLGTGDAVPALVPTDGVVERARVRKDQYELDTLRTAAAMLAGVVPGVVEEVQRGRSERDVALAIDLRLRQAGFERTAFATIVAGGPNAALPHAHPGERRLSENDLVVLDFGGVFHAYCVDLTRTVSVGPASARAREVYDAVRSAHDLAIQAVRPGQSRFAIDAAARDELTRCGLGEAFGHGTGHGLGIEVHEDPRIARRRPDIDPQHDAVVAGMVFTIEPGAYLPGWGGVRIEDDVVVTDTGVDVLTNATTELIEI
ncbi:MAG: Xaa-Pro peptidase family protein [Acidobacteriota bacterium]